MKTPSLLPLGFAILVACEPAEDEAMTAAEVKQALEETVSSARVEAETTEAIELSTDFTLGEGAAAAAEQLAAWWQSQAPCTEVTLQDAVVTIDFGELDDACTWNGQTYAGVHEIEVLSAERDRVRVGHTWIGFTNGDWIFDAEQEVSWTGEDGVERSSSTAASLTTSRGAVIEIDAQRTWSRLGSDLGDGLLVDGSRSWTSDSGTWSLEVDSVEMRAQDPVPQAGSYTMTNPAGKQATVSFARVDEDTIAVTWVGPRGVERTWNVSTTSGEVSE